MAESVRDGELFATGLTPAHRDVFHQPVVISAEHDVLRMLADPLRTRIVEVLADGAACTCHLVADLGAGQPNVSNHLRALREAGLVAAEPRGRFTYYRLLPDPLEAAAGRLADLASKARANEATRRKCP